jgi:ComF family protein
MVYRWARNALELFHPSLCLVCGAPGSAGRDLCADCHADLPWLGTACPRCALPLPVAVPCPACQRRPPPQTASTALFRYAFPVDSLIAGLKYGHHLSHARLLGDLLAERAAALDPTDLVLPVPLHPKRLATRGFNQAIELARPVAAALGAPLAIDLARRVRDTPAQTRLSKAERRRNLKGAFALTGAVPRRVLIVDDVMTTGSTVAALARVLRRGGAREVRVLAVARAE